MKQEEAPIQWGWWNNTPECFDKPIIVIESNEGKVITYRVTTTLNFIEN